MKAYQWIAAVLGLIGCGPDADGPVAPVGPSASAVPACIDVQAGGQTFAINEFTFKSFNSIQATIDGVATPVAVTTYLLGAPSAKSDGTLHAHTAHVFEFGSSADGVCLPGEDCFATDDHAVLDPVDATGLFRLNTRADIAVGHGVFANARGLPPASVHGTILLNAQPVATWSMRGRICPR